MILGDNLIGKDILLRTACEDDAEFILELRLNPKLNKFIKKTDPSVERQKQWIAQKQNEKNDYHMIIQGLDAKKLGTIALYDINFENQTFRWGRWVISEDAPFYASIESVILLYNFAFADLKLEKAIFEAQKGNKKVINFHQRFGAQISGIDDKFIYFSFTKKDFNSALVKYERYHNLLT